MAYKPQVLSAEQLGAVKLFGSRTVVRDGVRLVEPAQGVKAIRALLRIGYVQDDAAMMRILSDAGVNGPGVELFTRNKVVTRLPDGQGGGLDVLPNIPGITDDNLSTYAGSDADEQIELVAVKDDRVLQYKLNSVFCDATVLDKLQISPRRLQAAKRLAVSDPAAAAASLGEYLRHNGFPNCKVTAGDYARTLGRAREYIREFANTITYKDSAAPAVVSPTHLRMTFDGFEKATPEWTVSGPLKYATEVQAIYQLAIRYGPDRVMFFLGVETAMLGINICSEVTQEYYTGQVRGYSSLTGIEPMHAGFPAELTAEQQSRLLAASQKISPVVSNGAVIGSAVHVTDRHLILNEHTLVEAVDADRVPDLCGIPIHDSRTVAHDICMVRREGIEAQWVFRDPNVGERVVLCFSVGNTVEYSEVLRILSVHDRQIILSESNLLRKGASGAAVVALRDSALLGIFSTMRGPNVVCAAFSSAAFSIVTDYQSMASSEHAPTPSVDAGTRTYERMVKKGLLSFLEEVSNACASLYYKRAGGREYCGQLANVSGVWTTTVDPDKAQVLMQDGRELAFHTERNGLYTVVAPPPILATVPNVRTVSPGERVFLFTKRGDDVIMSSVRVVTHCMADMQEFVVEHFGDSSEVMTGGLILAEKDAAVLGQYVRTDTDAYGTSVVSCVSFAGLYAAGVPEARAVRPDVRAVVTEMRDWVVQSDTGFRDLTHFGKLVVDVVAGQRAYNRGMSIASGTATLNAEWHYRRAAVLRAFGWHAEDYVSFEKHDVVAVSYTFLALMYLRDPGGTSARLGTLLSQDTVVDYTPVAAEFPHVRPLSATGSVDSNRTRVSVELSDSGARLKELEDKLDSLSQLVRREGQA